MEKKRKLSLERKHNLTGWAFLLPAAVLIFSILVLSLLSIISIKPCPKSSSKFFRNKTRLPSNLQELVLYNQVQKTVADSINYTIQFTSFQ
jgi:hypothetical protein